MRAALDAVGVGSRALSAFLGLGVVVLAIAVIASPLDARGIAGRTNELFGPAFLAMFTALVLVAIFSWTKLRDVQPRQRALWLETGMSASNGLVTLALTFTLLGISLGIRSLATQELTPDNVQVVIRGLTENFSLAFMTTVVGLPAAALLRALLSITSARLEVASAAPSGDQS
jgi:hypothetical protein